jgi:hypothetical protein
MRMIMKTQTILSLLLIIVTVASIFLIWVYAATESSAESTELSNETKTNQNATTTNNVTKINQVIKSGLNECSNIETNSCLGVMYTLDSICQVAYFPNCFGDQWTDFIGHLQDRIDKGDYPDAAYQDDPYLTLNNHHYGSSDWIK